MRATKLLLLSLIASLGAPPLNAAGDQVAIQVADKLPLGKLTAAQLPLVADNTRNFSMGRGKMPPRKFTSSCICSLDARDALIVFMEDKNYLVWHKGQATEPFRNVNRPSFSPDGKMFQYIGARANDPKTHVFVNHVPQTPCAGVAQPGPRWSPDSKHLAYFVDEKGDNRYALFLDGKIAEQRFTGIWGPFFSPDSLHCMYNADQPGVGLVIDNDPPHGRYKGANLPFWSPDSKHTAMVVETDEGFGLLRDRNLGDERFNSIPDALFTQDSQTLAFIARTDKKFQLHLNDKTIGEAFGGYLQNTLALMPDGKSVRWLGQSRSGEFSLFIDGAKISTHPSTPAFPYGMRHTFAPDGRRFAYIQLEGDIQKLVNTQPFLIAGTNFKTQLFADGKLLKTVDDVRTLFFSPDSKRFASHVVLGEKQEAILCDGALGAVYPRIQTGTARFSPDSTRLAFIAIKPGGKAVPVVDGAEGPGFDGALSHTPLVWVDNHTLRALMISGTQVVSVTWDVNPKSGPG